MATCLKMAKMTIFRVGWDELEPNRSYLSHFPTWYSKSGHFPIESPIKNEKWPLGLSYGSIILQIVLWPYFTITHVVLTQLSDWTKKTILGHPRECMVWCLLPMRHHVVQRWFGLLYVHEIRWVGFICIQTGLGWWGVTAALRRRTLVYLPSTTHLLKAT